MCTCPSEEWLRLNGCPSLEVPESTTISEKKRVEKCGYGFDKHTRRPLKKKGGNIYPREVMAQLCDERKKDEKHS